MKKKLIFFCSILTFLIVVGSLLIAVGSLYKEKRIESETIDSDKYSLISGDSNDYIFTKSNKEIAKITYLNRSGALEYINLLKSSKDIKVLDIVPNKDKTNGYYFFSKEVDSNHTTYNYILVLSHTGVLIENISSKAKAKKVSLNISVEETMCYEHHPHPIIPPIIIYS